MCKQFFLEYVKTLLPFSAIGKLFSQIAFWCFFACSWEMETWREWKFCNKSKISKKKSEWNIAFDIKMMPLVISQHSFVKIALLPSRIFLLELIPRDTLLFNTNTTITKKYMIKWNKFSNITSYIHINATIEFEIRL